jgi:hypothetical protein
MCGKLNPGDLDVCQFCQARLKPVGTQPPDDQGLFQSDKAAGKAESGSLGAESPDWLSSIRKSPEQAPSSSAPQEEGSDWLSGFRDSSAFADIGEQLTAPAPYSDFGEFEGESLGESVPSSSEPPLSTPQAPKDTGAAGTGSDWLSRIDAQAEEPETPDIPELPSWLADLEEASPDVGPPEIPEWYKAEAQDHKAPKDEVPDWITSYQAIYDEEQDLLASMAEEASAAPQPPSPEQPPSPGEQPDWLAAGKEELPDWLAQASSETAETISPPPITAEPEEEQTPAWPPSGGEAAPDWLAGGQEELPDWLSQIAPEERAQAGVPPAPQEQELPEEEGEISAWLAGLAGATAGAEFPGIAGPEPETTQEGLFEPQALDWMAPPGEGVEEPQPTSGIEELGLPELVETSASEQPSEGELSWLSDLEGAFSEMPSEAEVLGGGEAAAPFSTEGPAAEELASISGEPLPAWLSEITDEGELMEAAPPSPAEEAEVEAELSPADLPTWLEAMRPVTAAAAAEQLLRASEMGEAEGAGPLAGLRGVLPAEPDISHPPQKPPAYSVKLQVSEIQQAHSELLKNLVQVEGEARPIPGRSLITSQRILRIGIGVVLLLSVLFALLTGYPPAAIPAPTSEAMAAQQLIEAIPAGAPVLLAIDYEPGFTGEVETALGIVVDHLMNKGAYLTIVSSLPTGPVQAERLIGFASRAGGHQYTAPAQYANLGFIPGGSIGLLNFALSPQQAMPSDLDGNPAWSSPTLQNIRTAADFAILIVATENADTARAWIEQVQPVLGATPMTLVTSAQTFPMVMPYFETSPQQVQGLVAGVAGGAAYESSLGKVGTASIYWNAFSLGLIVAGLLIIIGAAVNAFLAWNEQRKSTLPGEGQP